MVLSRMEWSLAVERALTIGGEDLDICITDAGDRAKAAGANKMKSRVNDGGYEHHLTGALGEMAWWNDAVANGAKIVERSFGHSRVVKSGDDLRHYDFMIQRPDRMRLTVDVKTGRNAFEKVLELEEDTTFGMNNPKYQVVAPDGSGKHLADIYVYCLRDAERYDVAVVGWAQWEAWTIAMPFKSKDDVDCLRITLPRLRPMDELYSVLTGKTPAQ